MCVHIYLFIFIYTFMYLERERARTRRARLREKEKGRQKETKNLARKKTPPWWGAKHWGTSSSVGNTLVLAKGLMYMEQSVGPGFPWGVGAQVSSGCSLFLLSSLAELRLCGEENAEFPGLSGEGDAGAASVAMSGQWERSWAGGRGRTGAWTLTVRVKDFYFMFIEMGNRRRGGGVGLCFLKFFLPAKG